MLILSLIMNLSIPFHKNNILNMCMSMKKKAPAIGHCTTESQKALNETTIKFT